MGGSPECVTYIDIIVIEVRHDNIIISDYQFVRVLLIVLSVEMAQGLLAPYYQFVFGPLGLYPLVPGVYTPND